MTSLISKLYSQSERNLTDQFYRTLLVKMGYVSKEKWEQDDNIQRLLRELNEEESSGWTTRPTQTWIKLYELEQHLIRYFDPIIIDTELNRRLFEAEALLRPELGKHYRSEVDKLGQLSDRPPEEIAETKRALYFRLLNDINWFYTNREESREYTRSARTRVATIFLVCLVLFMLVLGWGTTEHWEATVHQELQLFLLTGAAGLWGASFSMLIGLRNQLQQAGIDDLKIIARPANLLTRPVIGLGAATILLFLMQSGMLTGNVFPNFDHILEYGTTGHGGQTALPATFEVGKIEKNLALLIVWCFLAGFSEKLVPNLLTSKLSGGDKQSE